MLIIPCPPLEEIHAQCAPQHLALMHQLALPMTVETALFRANDAACRRLSALIYTLPASLADPGAGAGGLLRRCLSCARQAVALAASQELASDARKRLGWALAAVVRELGVVWRMEVRTPTGIRWCHQGFLAEWARERASSTLEVTLQVDEHDPGHGGLGLWAVGLLVSGPLLDWLGSARAVISAGQTPAGSAGTVESRLLEMASRAAHLELCDQARREQPWLKQSDEYHFGSGTRAMDLIASCRHLRRAGRCSINQLASPLVVSPSHTLLMISCSPRFSLLPAMITMLRSMRTRTRAPTAAARTAGVEAGVETEMESAALAVAMARAIGELAAGVLDDGSSWCVPVAGVTQPRPGAAPQEAVVHQVILQQADGHRQRRSRALILRNRALWGAESAQVEPFSGKVGCFRDHRRLPSIAAEELGFVTLGSDSGQAAPETFSAQQLIEATQTDAHQILDLNVVSARLLRAVATMPSSEFSVLARERWRRLSQLFPECMPSSVVVEALEAVVDQLQALRLAAEAHERELTVGMPRAPAKGSGRSAP